MQCKGTSLGSSSPYSLSLSRFPINETAKSSTAPLDQMVVHCRMSASILSRYLSNTPLSYSRFWTGTTFCSLQWRLMWGNIIEKRLKSFAFEKSPCISLSCKLVTVQYREFENSLFAGTPHLLSGETLRSAKRVKYLTKGQA